MDLLRHERTLKEINDMWEESALNETGSPMDRKTFFNWKEYISNHYGVNIETRLAGRNTTYKVSEDPVNGNVRDWLISTISVQNALISNQSIHDRILLEDIPSGELHLNTILDAMKSNSCIRFDYCDYWEDPITVTIRPYFVKLFRQHWKVFGPLEEVNNSTIESGNILSINGKSGLHNRSVQLSTTTMVEDTTTTKDTTRSYALDADRMKNLEVLDIHFKMPQDYSPEAVLRDCIGTSLFPDSIIKPQRINILVWAKYNYYLKSTPLHHSQEILYDCPEDGYTIFSYFLKPTDDFYREICKFGNYAEVLSPKDVRNEMMKIVKGMQEEYDGVSRGTCTVPNPLFDEI